MFLNVQLLWLSVALYLAQIKMLSERKQELERCLTTLHEENEQLQSTVDNLKDRTLVLEKLCQEKDLQVTDDLKLDCISDFHTLNNSNYKYLMIISNIFSTIGI